MKEHITKVCQMAYWELQRISSIRHYLTEDTAKTLVVSLVLSHVDCGNCLLASILECLLHKLQKIPNTSARLILKSSLQEHAKPLLKALHWLPISDHITYNCPACVTTPSLPPPHKTSLTFYKSTHHPVLYSLPQTHINWRSLCSKRNTQARALSSIRVL